MLIRWNSSCPPERANGRAELVEHHDVKPAEVGRQRTGLAQAGFLLEAVHQVDGVEVTAPGTDAHDVGDDGGGQVGLARAGPADQHDVAPVRQVGAAMQRAHQPLVDRRVVEHEGVEVLHGRQPGRRHPVTDGSCMPLGRLGAQQVGEDLHGRALALQARGDRLVEGPGHAL